MSRRNKSPLPCPHPGCHYKTVDQSNLKKHQIYHDPSKWFVCSEPGCTYKTADPSNFKKHRMQHDPEELKKFKEARKIHSCSEPGCGYTSTHKGTIRKHAESHSKTNSNNSSNSSHPTTVDEIDVSKLASNFQHVPMERFFQHWDL